MTAVGARVPASTSCGDAVRDHWTCWPRLPVPAGRRGQHSAQDGSTL